MHWPYLELNIWCECVLQHFDVITWLPGNLYCSLCNFVGIISPSIIGANLNWWFIIYDFIVVTQKLLGYFISLSSRFYRHFYVLSPPYSKVKVINETWFKVALFIIKLVALLNSHFFNPYSKTTAEFLDSFSRQKSERQQKRK